MSLVFKIKRWKIGVLVVVTVLLVMLLLQRVNFSARDYQEQVNASEGILLNIVLPTSYFHAGTQITMSDGNTVDIEDVEVGDKLLTYNIGNGKKEVREVCSKKHSTVDGFYKLNEGLLKVTGDDHAYIRKKNGLVGWGSINRAQDSNIMEQSSLYALEVGDYLFGEDGFWVRLDSIEYVEQKSEFYGLDVKTNDDFYANHTLVHNGNCECSGCPGGTCSGSGDCPTPSCDRSCSTQCHQGTKTCPCGSGGCTPSCSCTPVCHTSGTSTTNPAHPGYTGTEFCYDAKQWCQDPNSGCSGKTCPVEYGSNCYNPETNTAPPLPSTLYLCIGGTAGNDDGACTAVSGSGISESNPKKIALPPHAKRVYMKVSSVTAPAGSNSRGVRYAIRIDNLVNGWSGNCLSMYTYDRCQGAGWWEDSVILDNVNVSQANNIGLQHGAQYHVWGHSATLDRCDDGVACMVEGVSCSSDLASCPCGDTDGYFKINTPPQVVSVSPSSGWSGTVADEIPQGTCKDNNPQIFTVTYSDVDGASDISNPAIWIDNEAISVSLLHGSMRGMLRKGSRIRIYAEGTHVDGEYATMQLLINNQVVRTFTDVGYYKYYDHVHSSFVNASQIRVKLANDKCDPPPRPPGLDRNLRVDKIVLDGVTYQTEDPSTTTNDCCPLVYGAPEWLCCGDGYFQYSGTFRPSDGWKMFGLGYDASHGGICGALTGPDCFKNYDWDVPLAGVSLTGSENSICSPAGSSGHADISSCNIANTPVSWRVAAVRTSGNNLEVDWEVWFRDDIASHLDPVLDIYSYVYDGMGGADGWNDLGNRSLDFVSPIGDAEIMHSGTHCAPHTLGNNEMCMYVEAREDDSRDSGLGGILEWWYGINGSHVTHVDHRSIGGGSNWDDHVVIDGISGGDELAGGIRIYDMVGNMVDVDADVQVPGLPWIKTLDGDVYAALGFSNNIQAEFPATSGNWAMGSHWVSGNGSWSFGDIPTPPAPSREASHYGWRDSSYVDNNCNLGWYDVLLTLAMGSKCMEDFNSGVGCNYESNIPSGVSVLSSDRGIYEYSGSTTVSGGTCANAKVIFVNGTLTIGSTFTNAGADSACLFVARDGVTVVGGTLMGGSPGNPDEINAAFITDGEFAVEDDVYGAGLIDRLYIKGFVFADSTSFNRDLVWNDNTLYPAEYIEYDPRYIYLLRDMLGNRKFEQCECGICTDYAPCNNW